MEHIHVIRYKSIWKVAYDFTILIILYMHYPSTKADPIQFSTITNRCTFVSNHPPRKYQYAGLPETYYSDLD